MPDDTRELAPDELFFQLLVDNYVAKKPRFLRRD